MAATNITLALVALALAAVFFRPVLVRSQLWQATVTPLASIIGSGFLVAGPILAQVAGLWAWAAMAGLCAVAYLFGAAVRHNIACVEPGLEAGADRLTAGLERLASLVLALAYFVSVAYYLNLFAAFGLRLGDVIDPLWIRVAATAVIATVGLVGLLGGLDALEWLEVGAVGLKLAVIGGLFAALAVATGLAVHAGTFTWPATPHERGLHEVQVLLGLVILVQGFETSRYLGKAYDAQTRIRTMRWAQWIATGVYVVFMLLVTRHFGRDLPDQGGETAIIDMLAPVGTLIAPMLILAALASQFSAAVADMNGAGGLLAESFAGRVRVRFGNLATAAAAIGLTWSADIYQIITYASKMFVAYYGLQSLQATRSALREGMRVKAGLFGLAVLIALAVVVFAVPAAG